MRAGDAQTGTDDRQLGFGLARRQAVAGFGRSPDDPGSAGDALLGLPDVAFGQGQSRFGKSQWNPTTSR